jgi:phosphatidylglycerol:prolipoprotein diacylglycerol transferase
VYGVEPVLVETGWVRLWWYGLAYAVGLLTVDLWVWLRRERLGYEPGDVVLFSVLFAAGVLLGGRIFDVALYEWFYYEDHVRQIPRLWQGAWRRTGSCWAPSPGRFSSAGCAAEAFWRSRTR